MPEDESESLAGLQVSAITVIGWVTALSSLAIWLGWAWLSSRITNLEEGKTNQPSSMTIIRLQQLDKDLEHLRADFNKMDDHDTRQDVEFRQMRRDIDILINIEYQDRDAAKHPKELR